MAVGKASLKRAAKAAETEVKTEKLPISEKEAPEKTETVTETYTKALTLSLHVGADSADDNKISIEIEAMSAEGIGVKRDVPSKH